MSIQDKIKTLLYTKKTKQFTINKNYNNDNRQLLTIIIYTGYTSAHV